MENKENIKKKFYDTNILLNYDDLDKLDNFLISSKTIEELENIKTSVKKDEDIKFKARKVVRWLDRNQNKYKIVMVDKDCYDEVTNLGLEINNDNLIIASAYLYNNNTENIIFISNDVLARFVAKTFFQLPVGNLENSREDIYYGYKVIENISDEDLARIYDKDNNENIFDCLINEYVVIKNNDEVVDIIKWTESGYVGLSNKNLKSRMFGTIKPLDEIQRCAFDSVVTNDITVLYGKAGSGKTTIPMAYIWQGIETQKLKKCYIIHHFEPLKNAQTLGFEKGTHIEKLLRFGSIGNILTSKVGDISVIESMLSSGILDIIPTANIRGVEFESDSIVIMTEAQDVDVYTLKTLLQRCKQGCKIILEGDFLEQSDINRASGMTRLIDVFKGDKSFGCIKLKNNYRSDICNLADKM